MKVIITESQLKSVISEKLHELYYDTYSSAVKSAMDDAKSRGYEIEQDEVWRKIAVGSKRPKEGETTRVSLELHKGGKLSKKMLHIQVYCMGDRYELNHYIN